MLPPVWWCRELVGWRGRLWGTSAQLLPKRREFCLPRPKRKTWIFGVALVVPTVVSRLHVGEECQHGCQHLGHLHVSRQSSGERLRSAIPILRRSPGQAVLPDLRALLP